MCIPPLDPPAGPAVPVGFAVDATAASPYELLGLLVPAGATAAVTRLDGSHAPMPVSSDGLAVYGGPAAPPAVLATVTLPDGRVVWCGPGPVTAPADVTALAPADRAGIRDEPWNCAFAADLG